MKKILMKDLALSDVKSDFKQFFIAFQFQFTLALMIEKVASDYVLGGSLRVLWFPPQVTNS